MSLAGKCGRIFVAARLAAAPTKACYTFLMESSDSRTLKPTATLARFLVSHRPDDLPDAVRREATRSLLNWVGCAVGASRHQTVERALAALVAVFRTARSLGARQGRSPRHHARRADERDHLPHLRFRRHASADGHSPERTGGVGDSRARRAPAGQRTAVSSRVHPWRRGGMSHRQRGVSVPLRCRLAHHRHGGCVRGGSRRGTAARLERAADDVGARHCRNPVVGPARDVRHDVQAVPSGQRRAQRAARRPARPQQLHQLGPGRSKRREGSPTCWRPPATTTRSRTASARPGRSSTTPTSRSPAAS